MTSRTSTSTVTSRTSACTDCRGGGGEAGHSLGTGVFGQFSLAGNRVAALHWQPAFFLWEIILLTNNGIKSTREEATKFEKFKGRNPRKKPRKEKKRTFQRKSTVKLREGARDQKHYSQRLAFR